MKKKRASGLLGQLYMLVIICVVIIGVITYFSQYRLAEASRKKGIREYVGEVSGETIDAVKEYPAYKWLLRYWYEHADLLDIEYDVNYTTGHKTKEKAELLLSRHPGILLHYLTEDEAEALSPEDQKLYAEVIYSWLITRLNQIKKHYNASYLYCVVTDSDVSPRPYAEQFFVFSAADPGAVRGTEYKQVYTAGKITDVSDNKSLQDAMREAVESARTQTSYHVRVPSLDESGGYMDEYTFLEWVGPRPALIGISFNLADILKQVKSETWRGTVIAMLYQFFLLQIIMCHLLFFGIRPLRDVLDNIRKYTENKKSDEVRKNLTEALSGRTAVAVRHNEIGRLAEDFIGLTEEMDDHVRRIEKITAENERIEVELDVASKIQAQMLPDPHPVFPDHPEIDICAYMDPAKEVGGDFYDYFLIDDDHLALVIADVSSKGVPAALFMVIAKTLIKNRGQMGEGPAALLCQVNNELNERNEAGFFVTVWIAVIELSTGKGVAANAGHEHPVICRKDGSFELVTYKHSPAVGLIEDIPYKEHSFELSPGDRLFVYTDGVPEATNAENELFGTDRMLECLNRDPGASNEAVLESLREEIDLFTEGVDQFDDITMLCYWHKKGTDADGQKETSGSEAK